MGGRIIGLRRSGVVASTLFIALTASACSPGTATTASTSATLKSDSVDFAELLPSSDEVNSGLGALGQFMQANRAIPSPNVSPPPTAAPSIAAQIGQECAEAANVYEAFVGSSGLLPEDLGYVEVGEKTGEDAFMTITRYQSAEKAEAGLDAIKRYAAVCREPLQRLGAAGAGEKASTLSGAFAFSEGQGGWIRTAATVGRTIVIASSHDNSESDSLAASGRLAGIELEKLSALNKGT